MTQHCKLSALLFILFTLSVDSFSQQPVINSFLPNSGPVGTSVLINGSGFDPVFTNNIVFFGPVKAQVISSSSSQLNVIVPVSASYNLISVTTNNLTAYSSVAFSVTYPAGGVIFHSNSFAAKADSATGNSPFCVVAADFDNDGKADLVTTNNTSASISILRNIGSNGVVSFAPKQDLTTGSSPFSIAVADLNGDGRQDIAVTNNSVGSTVSVFLNLSTNGSISFTSKMDFVTGSFPLGIAAGDVDSDGKADLVVTNSSANTISILRNISGAAGFSFAPKFDIASGNSPYGIAVRDFDGDGKTDIAVVNQGSNTISVIRNLSTPGNISFDPKIDLITGTTPRGIAVGDLDGDGKDDLATTNWSTNTVSIFRSASSAGTIAFAPKLDSSIGAPGVNPQHVAIGDLTGDGKQELIVVNKTGNQLIVFKNNSSPGAIVLAGKVTYSIPGAPYHVVINDLDGDGKNDIAIACSTVNKVSVLRSTPPPVISAVTPGIGNAGTTVMLSGFNFRTDATANIVRFGAVRATVNSATNTSLNVTVPAGATYLPVSVTTDNLTGYSQTPFLQSFAGGDSILENSFAPKYDLLQNIIPQKTVISDVDGDGKPDIVVTDYSDKISVHRNTSTTGALSFATRIDLAAGGTGVKVVTGDLNGDGLADIITANGDQNTISVFRNTSTIGNVSFGTRMDYGEFGPTIHTVAITEINGDGKPDLVVGSCCSTAVFMNNSNGQTISFNQKIMYATNDLVKSVAVGDFNGDGRNDFVAGNSLYRNTSMDGIPSFSPAFTYSTGNVPDVIAVGDFNNDGKPDLAHLYTFYNQLQIFSNNSSAMGISIVAGQNFTTGTNPNDVTVGDMNGDGKPDIAVSGYEYDAVSVYSNQSSASAVSFRSKVDYSTAIKPYSISVGDLDGDGRAELVTANQTPNSLSILRFNLFTPLPQVPVVTSFSPASGSVGSVINIMGKNFSPSVSSNIVMIGGIRATINAASQNMLTVTVPAGTGFTPLSVTNENKLTGYSDKPFVVTFPGGGTFTTNSFDTAKFFNTGFRPVIAAIADIDRDNKADIITANGESNSISLLRNTSIPSVVSFAPRINIPTGEKPSYVTVADLDADGLPDIIVTNANDNTFFVYKNQSVPGTFSLMNPISFTTDVQTFGSPTSVAVWDLDSDGRPDIAVTNENAQTISLFRNTSMGGNISFAPQVNYDITATPRHVSVADLDGNGKPDLLVSTYHSNHMALLSNTSTPGTISFTAPVYLPSSTFTGGVFVANLSNDNRPDIVLTGGNSKSFSTYKNQSIRGTFYFSERVEHGNTVLGTVSVADLTGDGSPDIANSDLFNASVHLWANRDEGDSISFSNAVTLPVNSQANSIIYIASGDVDGDGKCDLVLVNNGSNNIAVLRNKIAEPFKFCPGGGGALTSNLSGSSYQWQLSTDSVNFSNLSDNSNYSGTHSAILQLNNLPSSWSGYQYRCLVDGVYSDKIGIRFSNNWTGAASNAWENAANWSCGIVPDQFTDVVVNAGSIITLNSNTTVASLTLIPGAQFTVAPGFNLTLTGH